MARPLIDECLKILNIFGLNPENQNNFSTIRFIISQILIIFLLIELLLQCVFNWNGLKSMEDVGIVLAIYQLSFKFFLIIICRKRLSKILKNIETFWPCNKYKKLEEIENIYKFLRKCSKFVVGLLVVLTIVYLSKPIISTERILPYVTYHPRNMNKTPNYELAYIFQSFTFFIACSSVVGFDGLFVAFVVNIVCEFKILKQGFDSISVDTDENKTLKDINKLIDHHNLVLECIKDLEAIYCILLLNLFLGNMFCICTGLLSIIAGGMPPSMDTLTKYGLYISVYVGQLFFYCTVGSSLITESESISTTAYNIKWWAKTQPKLRRSIVLIIQRANKTEYLTAGGMFPLNLDSFANIINSALSFFTFMQAVYETEE